MEGQPPLPLSLHSVQKKTSFYVSWQKWIGLESANLYSNINSGEVQEGISSLKVYCRE